jgi:hypothetical protein
MDKRLFFALLLSALSRAVAKLAPKPFVRSTARAATMEIRGGAGPLDPDVMAKIGIAVGSLQGVHGALAPSKSAEMFGVASTDLLEAIIAGTSTIILSTGLTAWESIVRGKPLNHAIGVGAIPGIVNCARALLNEEEKKLGVSSFGTYLTGAIYSAVAYACFADASYADTAIKLYAIWGLANGLALFVFPADAGSRGFGVSSGDNQTNFALRALGGVGIAKAVMVGALAQGVDALKAFGYLWGVVALEQIAYMFVTKDVEKCDMDTKPQYFYLLLGAAIAGTLAIE